MMAVLKYNYTSMDILLFIPLINARRKSGKKFDEWG
jgi:hypothetical protein